MVDSFLVIKKDINEKGIQEIDLYKW